MKDQKIIDMAACPTMPKRTPEDEIRFLKQELREKSIKHGELWEELDQRRMQAHSLVDIVCELRDANKRMKENLDWQSRRTDDYRSIHCDALLECNNVIGDYVNGTSKNKVLYEFAKKIGDILNRM